jgi:PKD repeat protein
VWDWGDGTPDSTTKAATHTYAADGDYIVTLTVTNANGMHDSDQQLVTVP